jgi:hypothetical protein
MGHSAVKRSHSGPEHSRGRGGRRAVLGRKASEGLGNHPAAITVRMNYSMTRETSLCRGKLLTGGPLCAAEQFVRCASVPAKAGQLGRPALGWRMPSHAVS